MRMQNKQFNSDQRLVNNGPLVVLGNCKKRDGPMIYHRRDGPVLVAGLPTGTGPPQGRVLSYQALFPKETGPPRTGVG